MNRDIKANRIGLKGNRMLENFSSFCMHFDEQPKESSHIPQDALSNGAHHSLISRSHISTWRLGHELW